MSKSPILRLAAAALIALCMAATPALAQTKAADPVVAMVDGHKIHLSELQAVYQGLPQQLREIPFDRLYQPLLEQVIASRLLATEGRKRKLQDDAEVKKRLAQIEDQLVQQAYLDKIVDEKATDAELKKRYDAFAKDFKGEGEIRASHILVKTEKEAREIIGELDKGGDFDKISAARAAGPGKAQTGDLGYFVKGQMVKEFADAAFALKKGEHSKTPVQTQFGWHVIKVTDVRPKPAPSFEEKKAELRQEMSQGVMSEEIGRLRGAAKIERFNADGSALKPDETKPGEKK